MAARVLAFTPRHLRRAGERLLPGDRVAGMVDGVAREGTVLGLDTIPGGPASPDVWIGDGPCTLHLVAVQWDDHQMVDAATLRRI